MKIGLECFATSLRKERIGLLCNQASITPALTHAVDLLLERGFALTAIFGPQHGLRGEKQANMIESGHDTDPYTGLPVYSLYSETRAPSPEMLKGIEALVIDLHDVGSRYYTYMSTMILAMKEAAALGIKVIVLDRPNPIGGVAMEGVPLDPSLFSFIGLLPILHRHGFTMGELALLAKSYYKLSMDLEVVPVEGWRRRDDYEDCGLPWILPSPNMPTPRTALVYPGACLLEGTNLSEGRGTTLPFELVGAPWIDQRRFKRAMDALQLPGVAFREACFEPTFDKYCRQMCKGIQIHILDKRAFLPFTTYCLLLRTAKDLFGQALSWLPPPYEYDHVHLPLDILLGDYRLRPALEGQGNADDLRHYIAERTREGIPWHQEFSLYQA